MEMEVETPRHPAPTPVASSGVAAAPPPPSPYPASAFPCEDVPGGSPVRARRSKRARAVIYDDGVGPAASPGRKRRGTREPRAAGAAASAPASPVKRNVRRARGLGKEEKGKGKAVVEDAGVKVRRRKMTGKLQASKGLSLSVKEDLSLAIVPYPPSNLTRGAYNERQNGCEGLLEMVTDLVMWNNVARSAFWFGSGSMVFMSFLSTDIHFSPISMGCQFGVVMLGLAFFKDSIFQRQHSEPPRQFQLTDEDVRCAARAVLPFANTIISMAQSIFSGDASMTLKVLPLLLFGAKFGHLLTTWRLLATGFFGSFTLPKLYSFYSSQVCTKAKGLKEWILNVWKSCPRKKVLMAVAATTSWNLLSVKTRILAGFFCLVALRYHYQYCRINSGSQREINRTREDQSRTTEEVTKMYLLQALVRDSN